MTGFTPTERPRIAVAADGSLAAIHDGPRIVITEVPSCAPFAEVGVDGDAIATELAWVGTPPRLLVMSRYHGHSIVRLVDPIGARTLGEMQLDEPMELAAAVGSHALALGAQGAVVLATSDDGLGAQPFPARAIPSTAGAAGMQLVVALPGAIEEWDPVGRLPKRRLKLARQAQITAVGGSDRVVWMTTQGAPSRIDVIPLVNRGQPKVHELPEPIACVASHPRSDLLACIGAESGKIWVIDLDGHEPQRTIEPDGIDRVDAVALVLGRVAGVLAAQRQRALTVIALDAQAAAEAAEAAAPTTLTIPPKSDSSSSRIAIPKSDASSPRIDVSSSKSDASSPRNDPSPRRTRAATSKSDVATPGRPRAATPKPVAPEPPRGSVFDNPELASFRDRVRNPRARTIEPTPTLWPTAAPDWREIIVMWTREAMTEPVTDAPVCVPIDLIVARYHVSPQLTHAIMLLYGAHLIGVDGAAPIGVAQFAGWAEALGRGELADKGIARYVASRVHLAPAVLRALDELAPTTGKIVGTPGVVSLFGPCVVVADGPLAIIAEACMSSVGGAILAARDDADPHELVAEARAYGAVAMVRARAATLATIPVDQPVILVADDDATAEQLGLPRLT